METKTMKNNPVVKTAKWLMSLMKNKIIVSLLLLVQGILFLLAPSGDMSGMVIIIATVIIAAAVINVLIHLFSKERNGWDIVLIIVNLIVIVGAVICLFIPKVVEPYVRTGFGILTIGTNLMNLFTVLKLENKKSGAFVFGLIVSVLMIGLGIAMLFAEANVIASIQQGMGIFMIINALTNIWYIIRMAIANKRQKAA